MSTPVNNSLTDLKDSTGQIMAIISAARQIPPGPSHAALGKQVATLVSEVAKIYGSGDGPIPGLVISCIKELQHIRNMVPKVWPSWHAIGYDDPRVLRHVWYPKVQAWEALGDPAFNLPIVALPSTGPIPVHLPSPAIPASNVAGPSTLPTTESRDKGKGKAVFADPEPEAEGSRKRKSPMMSEHSSQPPKSAMKTHKRTRSSRVVKSKPIVESEDEEPTIKPLFSRGVPEVLVPLYSTILARAPTSPRSPRAPTKKPFGPATAIAGSHQAVVEPSQPTPEPPAQAPPAGDGGDILIPGPNNPCHACTKQDWPCATRYTKKTGAPGTSCVYCTTKKIKCTPAYMGSPPPRVRGSSTTRTTKSRTPSRAPSKAPTKTPTNAPPASQTPAPSKVPPASQSKARTRSQSRGPSGTSNVTAVTAPKTQTRGRSKTITAVKAPAPAPAPAPARQAVPAAPRGPAVPAAALDVPMPDLHAMSIAIRDGAARIALLEARVAQQDGKIDTLQRLHEGLRREIIDRHPSFPLPDLPANPSSLLLNQSGPPTISTTASVLPPLIDLIMDDVPPTTATPILPDASAIDGILFEYNQVVHSEDPDASGDAHPEDPEDPDASGSIVDPGDPSNLVPEYDSSDDMDVEVEVKVEEPSEEVDMAT
ncbi:hypothetical protein DEU56DRAFT_956009 [Suillus clintonianus]|uniref:uncharacterized protein n=1 Tax=Suillus clintonianus TaxID=1904413 RepID=UPI001B87688D|nr:uncharacterized protein DEU56DRAFT_956009 [Suillus clintonianus]KAG2130274.1 hypothetical protein DEU56DRAFT_956009 [Suillus clintonianus]